MKRLTREQALQAALHHKVPEDWMRKARHVLCLTCISCIAEGVVFCSSEKDLRAQETVYSHGGDVEWYWTPLGYVCGACAEWVLNPKEEDDDA